MEIAKDGYERDLFLGNALIDMYAKGGSLTLLRDVVEDLPSQDVTLWNTLINGYAKYGPTEDALCLLVVRTNGNNGIPSWSNDLYKCPKCLWDSLIDMYIKCGLIMEGDCIWIY